HFLVAAVEARGQLTVLGIVRVDVRIQEEERVAPNLDSPDAGRDASPWELDLDHDLLPIGRGSRSRRHLRKVDLLVGRLLPAIRCELLLEIALGVEKADADQWDTEITCAFAMVAGQDSQTAAVNWQGF